VKKPNRQCAGAPISIKLCTPTLVHTVDGVELAAMDSMLILVAAGEAQLKSRRSETSEAGISFFRSRGTAACQSQRGERTEITAGRLTAVWLHWMLIHATVMADGARRKEGCCATDQAASSPATQRHSSPGISATHDHGKHPIARSERRLRRQY